MILKRAINKLKITNQLRHCQSLGIFFKNYSCLYKFLTQKEMILDSQFRFRKNHSTGHAIHHSVNIIKKRPTNLKYIY